MMKSRKKQLVVIILAILVLLGTVIYRISAKIKQAENEISIGVVLPLTGDLANFGKTVLNGVHMALDDFSVNDVDIAIRLIPEDSQAKPAVAVSAFQKLINANNVDLVIGALTSSETLAMAPIAQKHKVLLISPTASNPKLTNAGPYFYRVWPSDSFDGMVAAEYCFQKLNSRNAGIIFINNDYGLGLKDTFGATFERLGGNISFVDSYLENTTDFRTLLSKAIQNRLDVIYLPGHPSGIGTILKQSRELDIETKFFSNVAAEDKEFVTIAGTASTGLYFTAPTFNMAEGGQKAKDFINKYREKYAEIPDVHAVKGYEAAAVMLEAITAGNRNSISIKAFLDSGRVFDGISGKLRFDNNGDVITSMSIKRYSFNGSISILETIIPNIVK